MYKQYLCGIDNSFESVETLTETEGEHATGNTYGGFQD
jgi:hypothetical protein